MGLIVIIGAFFFWVHFVESNTSSNVFLELFSFHYKILVLFHFKDLFA
jgi:hypothetical protein